MGLENQKVSPRAPSAPVEGFNKLSWGQQRRLLLQVFGSALVTASISSLSGCGEQEGEEPTPTPTKSIEPTRGIDPTPVPSPTAERPLEPEPMKIELSLERTREILHQEGTGWEEIRENEHGILEVGRNFNEKWLHLGFILREAPSAIWQDGQILRAKYDSQNPLRVVYVDEDDEAQGWLSLVYGLDLGRRGMEEYKSLIEEQGYSFAYGSRKEEGGLEVFLINKEGDKRTIEKPAFLPYIKRQLSGFGVNRNITYEIDNAQVDRLTWINGEMTLYKNGQYMNDEIFKAEHNALKEPRALPGNLLERLFDILDEQTIKDQKVWNSGLKENRLTEEGWQLAKQIYEIWQGMDYPPLILKRPADSQKYLDLPGIFVENFTQEQEIELVEAVRLMKELFGRIFEAGPNGVGSYAAGDIKYALTVGILLTSATRERTCRDGCEFTHPHGYYTAYGESLRSCAFFPGFFDWGKEEEYYSEYKTELDFLRKISLYSAILHEGAHIRNKTRSGSGESYPRSNMVTARGEQAFFDLYSSGLTDYQRDVVLNSIEWNISMAGRL